MVDLSTQHRGQLLHKASFLARQGVIEPELKVAVKELILDGDKDIITALESLNLSHISMHHEAISLINTRADRVKGVKGPHHAEAVRHASNPPAIQTQPFYASKVIY